MKKVFFYRSGRNSPSIWKIIVPVTLFCDNNQTRGGLGRVCATGIYRSTGHVGFSEIQTEIFLEWKAPQFFSPSRPPFHLKPTLLLEGLTVPPETTAS